MKNIYIKILTIIVILFLDINNISIAQNIDTDNDGVSDIFDIDDDNDGITDVDELAETIRIVSDINSRDGNLPSYPLGVNQLTTNKYGELTELADGDFDFFGKAEENASYYHHSNYGLSIRNSTDCKPYIFMKTQNVDDFENTGNRVKSKIAFDNSVSHLSFSIRNFHSSAAATVIAYYQGNPITITAANFTLIGNPYCSANNIHVYNGNSVVNNASDANSYSNNTKNTAFIYIPELVDSVVIYTGRTTSYTGHTYFGIGDFKYIRQEGIDTDGDGYLNHLDLDSDNDGISDIIEAGGADTDYNGLVDNSTDSDGDGLVDSYDLCNNDGPNGTSACTNPPYCINKSSTLAAGANTDTDGDGSTNHLDLDSDGDLCFDMWEAYNDRSSIDPDQDGIHGYSNVSPNSLVNSYGMIKHAYITYDTDLVPEMINAAVSICKGIDYSDAPGYGSGASHAVSDFDISTFSSDLMLGSYIDLEITSSVDDNSNGFNDEDGVKSFPTLTTRSNSYTVWVKVTALELTPGSEIEYTVSGWLDFNSDGIFDESEKTSRTINTLTSSVGSTMNDDINEFNEVRMTWTDINPVSGNTYARFRIAYDYAEVMSPDGTALSGEVEDLPLRIDDVTPIELLEFNAECNGSNTIIKWSTASEKNNNFFTLEKSIDTKNWEIVTEITGAGTSNILNEYSFNDEVNNATTYYRLTQTDFDGNYKSFSPITVETCMDMIAEKKIKIYPNPASDNVNLELVGFNENKHYQILIYNAYGTAIYEAEYNNATSINTSNFNKGMYVVKIINNNETYNKTLIIN